MDVTLYSKVTEITRLLLPSSFSTYVPQSNKMMLSQQLRNILWKDCQPLDRGSGCGKKMKRYQQISIFANKSIGK